MKSYLIIIIVLLLTIKMHGQENSCEPKTIFTNPGNSVNNEKPSKRNSNPTIFNWKYGAFDMLSNRSSITLLQSPFHIDYDTYISHFDDLKDFNWEDGWELIKQEFGQYLDSEGKITYDIKPFNLTVDYPLFVLYNRYLGKLRVFVAMTNDVPSAYQDVEITLSLYEQAYNTSLFNMSIFGDGEASFPLEKIIEREGNTQTAIHRYHNGSNTWCYSDFFISYDPCNCMYGSELKIEVYLISKANIEMTGESEGTIVEIDQSQSQNTNNKSDISFNLNLNNLESAAKKSIESYRSLSSWSTNTNTRIEDHYRIGPNLSYEEKEKMERSKEIARPTLSFLEKLIHRNDLQPFLKMIPVAGAIFSVFDLFSIGGEKESQPQKVSITPMTISSNYKFHGEITTKTLHRSAQFFVPGSKIPNFESQDRKYPYYNQTMGVFNLLRTPKLVHNVIQTDTVIGEPPLQLPSHYYTYRLKLASELEYVINPAAGFSLEPEDIDILAAIQIEYQTSITHTVNLELSDGSLVFENDRTIRTQYVPLGCLEDLVLRAPLHRLMMHPWNQLGQPSSDNLKVYLNLIIRLKRIDAEQNTDRVVFKHRYKLKSSVTYSNFSNALHSFPDDLNFDGNSTIEADKVYFAWRKIILEGSNIQFPNYEEYNQADFKAGYEVRITGEQRIPTWNPTNTEYSHTFTIEYPFNCGNPTPPPITISELNNFCINSDEGDIKNYKPILRLPMKILDTLDNLLINQLITTMDITPNPFDDNTTITVTIPEASIINLAVYDMLGRKLEVFAENAHYPAGEYSLTFYSRDLPSGMLYVSLISGDTHITKPLILIK